MSAFVPLPLGRPIPDRPHAVSCSLPTMRDVVGYEEKDPATLQHLGSGYPRFVLHRFVAQLARHVAAELDLTAHEVWLACSARMADALAAELGSPHVVRINHEGLHGIAHPRESVLFDRAKRYLQNVGGFLGSREAEDRLALLGLLPAPAPETTVDVGALDTTLSALRQAFPGTENRDLVLAPSGMNAFHAAWRSLADLQASRGRTVWIQFGWLYLDTIAQLRRFRAAPLDYVALPDVTDLTALAAACAAAGDRFAGVVTEAPTNPLVQTADLPALHELVHRHGGRLVIDPTLVSAWNINVLPFADVVVTSLTKYAAAEGDVIAGAVVINPAGPDADWLRGRIARRCDSIYHRDLARLAAQIGAFREVVTQTNHNAAAVVDLLTRHPAVARVFWPLQPGSRENYLRVARSPAHLGSMISFTVRGPLADFYDRLPLAKGPSFGMRTTLICPFIYLAHYDLVTSETGRAELAAHDISPDLLRLSVGCEPAADIVAALAEALDALLVPSTGAARP